MYLKSIVLENVGPIPSVNLTLPFAGERPLPVVLVGANGSGKTTLLSFIVNALVAFKQEVYDEPEVASDRVYRIRSGLFLRGGTNYYHAKLEFDDGLTTEEWRLDRNREQFEKEVSPLPPDDGWKKIADGKMETYTTNPPGTARKTGQPPNELLKGLFFSNVVLFFPSDRFEPPNWLNQQDLSTELKIQEPAQLEGETKRRIFARSLLKPTLEWLHAVKFDALVLERQGAPLVSATPRSGIALTSVILTTSSKESVICIAAVDLLERILRVPTGALQLTFVERNNRRITALIQEPGKNRVIIPSLLGLSAGQSSLFCLFCNILRDADLAGVTFAQPSDIRGIVLIDEADLHLHLDLQFKVLPELMKMFPKIQFIVTAHSPLFVMGMRETFSEDGLRVIDMPTARRISTEAYTEFVEAFEAFGRTKRFEDRMLQEIMAAKKPLLVVEGKHDKTILQSAWSKLKIGMTMPFEIVSCGEDGVDAKKNEGGANRLRLVLSALGATEDVQAVGLFDNDETANGQFKGLKAFIAGDNESHKVHPAGRVHAILLPVPPGREILVPTTPSNRLLELEHYFNDAFLELHNAKQILYPGLPLFSIQAKPALAMAAQTADAAEIVNFCPLLDRLLALFERTKVGIGTTTTQTVAGSQK